VRLDTFGIQGRPFLFYETRGFLPFGE